MHRIKDKELTARIHNFMNRKMRQFPDLQDDTNVKYEAFRLEYPDDTETRPYIQSRVQWRPRRISG